MRPIKLSPVEQKALIDDFAKYIIESRFDKKIKYEAKLDKCLPKNIVSPVVNITASAYVKMASLIDKFESEVGWHGCVHKQEHVYTIYDILTYPQAVTSSTVTCDDKDYGEWLIKELPDEIFNNLRFHGHSHVNMTTSPSSTDQALFDAFLKTSKEGDFYIFGIFNKRGNKTM